MHRTLSTSLAAMELLLGLVWATVAAAGDGRTCPGNTPNPNAANLHLRVFNDCPTSSISYSNSYPSSISMSEALNGCSGFANLHTWSFSIDGGISKAQFENCSAYAFCADVVLTGGGDGQAGLRISPWYDPDAAGLFSVNSASGEIFCSGGRLPFYSFTASQGITYIKGVHALMKIIYTPRNLSMLMPATVEYRLKLGADAMRSSGPRVFDQGSPADDPPHGLWGESVPAYAGGFFMPLLYTHAGQNVTLACQWSNICYEILPTTAGVLDLAQPEDAVSLTFGPAPFRGAGQATFELSERSHVELAVYDIAGTRVALLAAQEMEAGRHERAWDAKDLRGRDLGAGIYFVRLEARGLSTHRVATHTVTAVHVR